jgi:hypothetical protein
MMLHFQKAVMIVLAVFARPEHCWAHVTHAVLASVHVLTSEVSNFSQPDNTAGLRDAETDRQRAGQVALLLDRLPIILMQIPSVSG